MAHKACEPLAFSRQLVSFIGSAAVNQHEQIQKSRLGRLLVNRGYISEKQLDQALHLQVERGVMLGEVLVEEGWISDRELQKVLRHQKNYRFATAAVTMIVAPLQPMMAMAATPMAAPVTSPRIEVSEAQLSGLKGLQALDDEELSGVNAQGFFPGMALGPAALGQNADGIAAGLLNKYDENDDYENQDDEEIVAELADTVLTVAGFGPISNLIDADITIEGLKYSDDRPMMEALEDGRMKFYMPESIDLIAMENIRVKGSTDQATMGSIYMSDISYGPRSSYTIGGKSQF